MSETDLVRQVIEELSKYERRLFRNNVGMGWQGKWVKHQGGPITLPAGAIIIYNPRAVHFGLAKGSGDVIGPVSREVTPEMVGTRVAVFASGEAKLPGRATTDEQTNWNAMVKFMGGISGQFRSVEEAAELFGAKRR